MTSGEKSKTENQQKNNDSLYSEKFVVILN